MPRKKKTEVPPEGWPTTILDDDGIERETGKIYFEKFKYKGNPDVFMLSRSADDGDIIYLFCRRDVRQAILDMGLLTRSLPEPTAEKGKAE